MRVLVVNAGSSSLKVSLVGPDDAILADHEFDAARGRFDDDRLKEAVGAMDGFEAIGHRVVHGGSRYSESVRISPEVVDYLTTITDLAPLHLPAALAGIAFAAKAYPKVPAVACFDTAFHSRMPAAASTYAIPEDWRARDGIRRYGFHGFSHSYSSRIAARLLGSPERELRVVTCHLGSGASLAAVFGGRSVDTTMGFTPLEGLVMATRSGSVDPGMLLWLQRHAGLTEAELNDALDRRSGLLALAGTGDMRELLQRASAGDAKASFAIDVYVHRLRACIASMAAAMAGLDAVVFTGGVGENATAVRTAAAGGLGFLGLAIDPALNSQVSGDAEISAANASVRTLVIHAHEDVEVARAVRQVLSSAP
ncbi:MAG TPA: acetate/propionate family kinase [Candidatus Micrarchaeaceae archaeon]|nr:acetate/propionate family kinase [Candidatus Micrarchaeaceae archaeon]